MGEIRTQAGQGTPLLLRFRGEAGLAAEEGNVLIPGEAAGGSGTGPELVCNFPSDGVEKGSHWPCSLPVAARRRGRRVSDR